MDRPIGLISRPFWRSPSVVRTEWKLSVVGAMLVALVLLTFIGWLYLDQAAMIRETETDIENLNDQHAHYLREFRILQGELARRQSAERVWSHADSLNLQGSGQIDTLVVPLVETPAEWQIETLPVEQAPASDPMVGAEDSSPLMSVALWLESLVSAQPSGD